MGGHAVHECMSSGWHMLQEDVSYWETCHTGGQVLLEGMSYRSQEDMFLQVYIFYGMAYLLGGHVLQKDMSCTSTGPTSGYGL